MEQSKKSGLLLAAVILGLIGLVLWGLLSFIPLMTRTDGTGAASFFSEFPAMVIVVLITLLAAVTLNALGRLKYDTEKTFAAGLLYLISFSIPSAVLCFIGFAQFKKQGLGHSKRSETLLGAVTLGLCGLILWGLLLFAPLLGSVDGRENASFFVSTIKLISGDNPYEKITLPGALFLLELFLGPISLLAALVLNALGWLKNDAKKTLVAGILYIVSLTIPSAVLCLIGWAKLKKQAA